MSQAAQAGEKLGYVWLQPGVTRGNGRALLYCGLTGIPVLACINFIQPVILEVILGIPNAPQRPLTGAEWPPPLIIRPQPQADPAVHLVRPPG